MRLTVDDIHRLNAEMERQKQRALERVIGVPEAVQYARANYEDAIEYECIMDSRHGDWGDRD